MKRLLCQFEWVQVHFTSFTIAWINLFVWSNSCVYIYCDDNSFIFFYENALSRYNFKIGTAKSTWIAILLLLFIRDVAKFCWCRQLLFCCKKKMKDEDGKQRKKRQFWRRLNIDHNFVGKSTLYMVIIIQDKTLFLGAVALPASLFA